MSWSRRSFPAHTFLALLAVAFGLIMAPGALAQRYFFENISVQAQGLSASKVYTVVQGTDGRIWIGTETGLDSYDGISVFNHGKAEGVMGGGVRALLIDKSGAIWAGHLDGSLTHFDGHRFRTLTINEKNKEAITGIAEDKDGRIWVSTAGDGAWKLGDIPEEGAAIPAEPYGESKGLRTKLLGVTALRDGRLCFVEDGAGVRYLENGAAKDLPLPGVQGVFRISAMFQDGKGNVWVGTQGGGAYRINDEGNGRVDRFDITNGMRSNTVYCFGEDGQGNVWAGTIDGGATVIGGTAPRTYYTDNGLHSRFVRCVVRDREGNLLIGTNDSGLDIFKGDRFVSYGEADGLNDPKVFAVMEDRNGRTWFGTNGGIVILGKDGATPEYITSQKGQLTTNFIRSLKEDDNGYVWVGTDNGGLLRFDPRTGKAQYDIELSGSLAENKVTALEIGQTGEIWVGGLNGLRRHLPGSTSVPTVYTEEEGLAGNHVNAIFKDRDGAIWVGSTVHGVTRIDNGKAHALDLGRSFTATCFTQDKEGRIWVGTEGLGIIVLDKGKEVQRFTMEEGLLSNTVKALGADGNGHVWIGTNKGLNKWRHKNGGFIAFTERAGFTGIEVKPNAVCTMRSGAIMFGTVDGATRVGNEKEQDISVPPLVSIRSWKVNMEDRPLEQQVSLPHSDRSIRIAYGSVALSDPGAVRYMFKLDGLDEDWQPVTTATEAYYPTLPPARYAFKVKAMDRSGVWTDPPAEYSFSILPPWYRSWWFYTALALFIGIVLFSWIKVREQQLRMRNLVLERKVEERTAEVVAQSREIEGQKARIEDLLLNILPKEISEELKEKGKATARRHEAVTVLFTDMKGFTRTAERMTPEQLVSELDECFIHFDEIIGRYGIEKIKTIGDSYMCAAGVPRPEPFHAHKTVLAALEIRDLMKDWRVEREQRGERPWVLRIGAHSGAVVAGVVGRRKFAYDIWGDTVNTASRMESSGEPGEVNISGATYELVKDRFECIHRGGVEAKNKGRIEMYFVRRIKPEFSKDPNGSLPNERMLKEIGLASALQELA